MTAQQTRGRRGAQDRPKMATERVVADETGGSSVEHATRGRAVRASTAVESAMTEAELLRYVRVAFVSRGFRVYHTHRSDRSDPGFPDVVAVKRPRVYLLELKREGKYPTPDQRAWLADLSACGLVAVVLRPSGFREFFAALDQEV